MTRLKPTLLLQEERSGLVDLQFYGYIVFCDKNKTIKTIGETDNYPFFHRSCAKPMQASLVSDYKTKEFYGLTDEEIAVCCASHSGEAIHIEILKRLLDKTELKETNLQCPVIEPLTPTKVSLSTLHNNCSGKHALMLAICKQQGWDIKTYLNKEHPLQIAVYKKIQNLCEANYDLPFTLDGCTAPVWATSLEELSKGFWNLFLSGKHPEIENAYNVNPQILGGQNRLDTQIMEMNQKLKAKVGAGGLCSIVNTDSKEVLSFKIIDADMRARAVVTIETLKQIGWVSDNSINNKLLDEYKTVTTENGVKVGEYKVDSVINRTF